MTARLTTHLEMKGLRRTNQPENALLVTDASSLKGASSLLTTGPQTVMICICTTFESKELPQIDLPFVNIFPVTGPFHTSRLDEIISEVNSLYEKLSHRKVTEPSSRTLPFRSTNGQNENIHPSTAEDLSRFALSPPPIQQTQESSSKQNVIQPLPVKCALLVDDNPINLRILRLYCEKRKIPYLLATDGLEAIAQFTSAISSDRPVDLVFMDLQMPRCDGIRACKEIRQCEAEKGIRSPSVMFIITGQDSPEDRDNSFSAGADQFLVKPVVLKVLDRELAKYFAASGAS
jgi:CheY-like chemotaxis protein